MKNLDSVFPLLDFLNQFRAVERKVYTTGKGQMENDAEHSYQLAVFCWFVAEHFKLNLDMELVFKYALAHDLVETFSGDTPFWDEEAGKDKNKRENSALEQMKGLFGQSFPEILTIIKTYEEEKKKGAEASFVYALDKLIPMLNIYQDNGRSWKELYPDLKLERAIEIKREKIKFSPHAEEIFDELVVLLRERKNELFANPD